MHARRLLVPIALLAAYAYVHCDPRSYAWRDPVADDMPRAPHALVVPDAPRSIEELTRRLEAVIEREGIAGTSIALVDRDGPVWIGGIGVRDRTTRAPMQADTAFRVGSLTKSIVALGVMRLAEQGKLDVDAPLRDLLPDVGLDNPWESVAPVTLAQCMEHTAGLDDMRFNEIFADDETMTAGDTLRINPRSRKIRWRPGTRHGYSNVGYTLAARAIEVVTGEPFDVYLRREILAPLGIIDADFRRTPTLESRLATGYMNGEATAFLPFAHRPAGSLLASATDLAKLVHFWVVRGAGYPPIISPAGLARIERSGTLPYPHIDNQYGFANYADVAHPTMSHGHDGGTPGFHASYRYFSDLGVGYVMLINGDYTFRGYFQIRSLLYAYLTRDRTPAPAPAASNTERPGARFFALANPNNEFFGFIDRAIGGYHVAETSVGLRITALSGADLELVPAADGGYRLPKECGSSVRFTTNADGTPVLLMSFGYAEAGSPWFAQLRYWALGLTMVLLKVAPLWAAAVLLFAAIKRRRPAAPSLILWPAIAGLSCYAMPRLLDTSFFSGVIGKVHPLTVALCGFTLLFAIASTASLVCVLRWSTRPDRPRMKALIFPAACAIAFFSLTIWLGANGWIGIRTWSW